MPTEKELLDLQKTLYTSKNPTRRWLHCMRRDWILNELRKVAGENNNKAMEIGPGAGIYLPVLSTLFKKVVAVDIENAFLEEAKTISKQYPNLCVIADDITNSKMPAGTLDLLLCSEVIEHVPKNKVENALLNMYSLLKPGGKLIITTPQKYSTLEIVAKIAFLPIVINIVRLIYREAIIKTGHINLMTEKEISKQLENAGFKIIEKYKTGFYMPLISEFTGTAGLKLEKWLESKLRAFSILNNILWTQYYVATKVTN